MNLSLTTTAEQDAALEKIVAQINAARHLDDKGQPIGDEQTAQGYLEARINDVLGSYVAQVVGTEAEDVKKAFLEATPQEREAIKAAVPVKGDVVNGGGVDVIAKP